MRILIVFNEPSLQSALAAQLQQRGCAASCISPQDLAGNAVAGDKATQLSIAELGSIAALGSSAAQSSTAVRAAHDYDEDCLVIDCASRELAADGTPVFADDLFRQLVDSCEAQRARLLLLSDSRVFPSGSKQRYRETEAAQPSSAVGKHLHSREQYLREHLRQHIVLRSGPLIAASGNNLLTDLLQQFRRGGAIAVSSAPRFCPTPVADLARVLSAICEQIDCAAQCWGTYHYHSSDAASSYEFAEVLLAAAAQYWDVGGGHAHLLNVSAAGVSVTDEPSGGVFPTLNCQHIRDTFGIQQLPWRKAIPQLLKTIYAGQST